ncbi:dehydrin Xero 1-like [Neltuma alba]|uniref:dehydrin Xero 1-like n=1 Tax=Neltuma alba TaxID=207710 RepID=UPI0010A3A536|nr:dehydrin Xero 1-like [Prosopis alba]
MAHFQNQYGAVPVSHNPIQKEMDTAGDTTGIGSNAHVATDHDITGPAMVNTATGISGTEHVATNDDITGPAMVNTNPTTEPTDETLTISSDTLAGGENDHHEKKGIMEKIKEKLPGKHHHQNK